MKTDRFEDFVREHKADFGPDVAAPDVWAKIKKREPKARSRTITWQYVLNRAASVVIIFVASYYFHDYMSGRGASNEDASNDPLLTELREADIYYSSQIQDKKNELFSLTRGTPALQTEVNNELADLDNILLELKQDLQDDADNQEVVEAMMQNYRLKLEILEDMLEQIKAKHEKKDKNEKSYSI